MFQLSDNQRKELFERGTELKIAIPHPPHDVTVGGAIDYVRRVLDVDRRHIRHLEVVELTTAPMIGQDETVDDLTTAYGRIIHDTEQGPVWPTCQILAIVVTLRAVSEPRHIGRFQWAGEVDV